MSEDIVLKAMFGNIFKGAISTIEDVENEKKKEDEVVETLKKVGVAVGVVAGVALLGWVLSKVANCGERKVMKAPGRDNCYIYRDVFESDPSRYFRDLRN